MLRQRTMNWWETLTTWAGHTFSGAAIVGAIVGFFPPVAAAVALCWYAIQIYESDTVQTWMATRRARKIAAFRKAIQRLEAQTHKKHATRD